MKIDTLTFYRFLAASIVVFFHFGRDTAFVSLAPGFLSAGPEMVSFFFDLSGFMMVVAYWEREFDPPRYYRARLIRILPTYFLALLAALFFETAVYSRRAVVMNALFLQAWFPPYPMSFNGPSWSLSVEMFFYLIFPLLLWFLKPGKIKATTLLIGAGGVWIFALAILTNLMNSPIYKPFPSIPNDLIFYFPLSHFSSFLMGVAGGYFFVRFGTTVNINKWLLRLGILITTVVLIVMLNNRGLIEGFLQIAIPFAAGFFAPLFLLLILLTSLLSQASTREVFGNKVFILLGDASYALYIFQRPFHQFFEAHIFPTLGISGEPAFYLYFVCLILFSIAIFLFVEKPVKRLLRPGSVKKQLVEQA